MVRADLEQHAVVVADVDVEGAADDGGAEDGGGAAGREAGDLADKGRVVLPGDVGEADGAGRDAAGGGVEGGVGVGGLEHVPVWENVEVAGEQGVVGVSPDVPGVRGRDVREEVVRVAADDGRAATRELRVEEDRRRLRHARDGLAAEVAERGERPGVEVAVGEVPPGAGGDPGVHHELGVSLDAVDAR